MSNPTWIVTVTAGPDAGRAVGVTAPDAGAAIEAAEGTGSAVAGGPNRAELPAAGAAR